MSANVIEEKQTHKRYLVTISYYSHQPNDEEAKKTALAIVRDMNKADDCKASVDEIVKAPFGKPMGERIL
jgi:hypothetical protein